jgi:uncharacterized membrane protein
MSPREVDRCRRILVVALSAQHSFLSDALRRSSADPPIAPTRALRALAPLTLVAIAAIAWLVLLKPF